MSLFQSFILGIVQGIGEFLPISSSAHLFLTSYLLNFKYQGLKFDVMLHLGTLFAILIYFYKDIHNLAMKSTNTKSNEFKFIVNIVIATIPAAVLGFLLEDIAEKIFRDPLIISLSLILFSFIIYFFDKKPKEIKEEHNFNVKDAVIAGLFQSIALIPGASRSAMSIIGLLLCGYKRYSAARISFFMSIPVILGAGVFEARKLSISDINIYLIIAFFSSFISAILSIKFLLEYLKKHNLSIFLIYRIILGILVILKYFNIF